MPSAFPPNIPCQRIGAHPVEQHHVVYLSGEVWEFELNANFITAFTLSCLLDKCSACVAARPFKGNAIRPSSALAHFLQQSHLHSPQAARDTARYPLQGIEISSVLDELGACGTKAIKVVSATGNKCSCVSFISRPDLAVGHSALRDTVAARQSGNCGNP